MKHVGQELTRIIEELGIQQKDIAKECDISTSYMSAILQKSTISADLLEKVCNVLGVTPASFFDDWQEDGNNPGRKDYVSIPRSEYARLRQLLEEKERTINILLAQSKAK